MKSAQHVEVALRSTARRRKQRAPLPRRPLRSLRVYREGGGREGGRGSYPGVVHEGDGQGGACVRFPRRRRKRRPRLVACPNRQHVPRRLDALQSYISRRRRRRRSSSQARREGGGGGIRRASSSLFAGFCVSSRQFVPPDLALSPYPSPFLFFPGALVSSWTQQPLLLKWSDSLAGREYRKKENDRSRRSRGVERNPRVYTSAFSE